MGDIKGRDNGSGRSPGCGVAWRPSSIGVGFSLSGCLANSEYRAIDQFQIPFYFTVPACVRELNQVK